MSEIEELIDELFDKHDLNHNQFLEKDEARHLLNKVAEVMSSQVK